MLWPLKMRRVIEQRWFLAVAVLVALALRLGVSNRALWHDEAWTYWQALDPRSRRHLERII